jgi:hypothetical protein
MWKNLSLRMRLVLPLAMMFVAALPLGAVSLQLFAPIRTVQASRNPLTSNPMQVNLQLPAPLFIFE